MSSSALASQRGIAKKAFTPIGLLVVGATIRAPPAFITLSWNTRGLA